MKGVTESSLEIDGDKKQQTELSKLSNSLACDSERHDRHSERSSKLTDLKRKLKLKIEAVQEQKGEGGTRGHCEGVKIKNIVPETKEKSEEKVLGGTESAEKSEEKFVTFLRGAYSLEAERAIIETKEKSEAKVVKFLRGAHTLEAERAKIGTNDGHMLLPNQTNKLHKTLR